MAGPLSPILRAPARDRARPTNGDSEAMIDRASTSAPKRFAFLAWGVTCYAVFFACFLYAIAFIGAFPIVAKTIDSGEPGPLGTALAVNLGLLSLFAVQHSGMARPAFKRAWTKVVPEAAERPTYVLLSTLALVALFAFWQPIGGAVWTVTNPAAALLVRALYFTGWILLLYATALIDHFDLFGLRQAWLAFRGRRYTNHPFATPGLYAHVRHPLYVAWAIIFWSTPVMTFGHLLFAAVATAYMVVAVFFEERDLVSHFGDAYRRYQESTPKYVPRVRRKRAPRVAHAS
jgi:protein-S-isoprenylcysteine O-methyltransferase Ste14